MGSLYLSRLCVTARKSSALAGTVTKFNRYAYRHAGRVPSMPLEWVLCVHPDLVGRASALPPIVKSILWLNTI